MILILYVATLVPFKFSFVEDGEYKIWEYLDFLIDFLFTIDIFVTIFTPVEINGELETKKCKIFCNYAKTTLIFDVLSVLPMELLLGDASGAGDATRFAKFAKAPRIYKMLKITKLLRALRLKKKKKTCLSKILDIFTKSDMLFITVVPIYLGSFICA
jgi:Ion transport protein